MAEQNIDLEYLYANYGTGEVCVVYCKGHVPFDLFTQEVELNTEIRINREAIKHGYGRRAWAYDEYEGRYSTLYEYDEPGRGRFPITVVHLD